MEIVVAPPRSARTLSPRSLLPPMLSPSTAHRSSLAYVCSGMLVFGDDHGTVVLHDPKLNKSQSRHSLPDEASGKGGKGSGARGKGHGGKGKGPCSRRGRMPDGELGVLLASARLCGTMRLPPMRTVPWQYPDQSAGGNLVRR